MTRISENRIKTGERADRVTRRLFSRTRLSVLIAVIACCSAVSGCSAGTGSEAATNAEAAQAVYTGHDIFEAVPAVDLLRDSGRTGDEPDDGPELLPSAVAAPSIPEGNSVVIPDSISDEWPKQGRVMTGVNIRTGADSDSQVMTMLKDGAEIELTGKTDNGWYRVSTEKGEGYVLSKYVIPDEYIEGDNWFAREYRPDLTGIDPEKPVIAMTFDDGPRKEVTDRILDVFEAAGGKATFFVMGIRVTGDNNDCLRRMAEKGFEIGNHTFNHDNLNKLDEEGIRAAVRKCDYMIEETCGRLPSLLRPPGGNCNERALASVGDVGYPSILWSVDTRDWETRDTKSTVDRIMSEAEDGHIILMHDVYRETAEAVEIVVPLLKEKGFQFVTVSQLAALKGTEIVEGTSYTGFRGKPGSAEAPDTQKTDGTEPPQNQ